MPTATPSDSPQPTPSTASTTDEQPQPRRPCYDVPLAFVLADLPAGPACPLNRGFRTGERVRSGRVLRLPKPPCPRGADGAAWPEPVGRTVKVPGVARVERQSVRYAARAQPLDGSDRRDRRISRFCVRVDPPRTPQMPGGYPEGTVQRPRGVRLGLGYCPAGRRATGQRGRSCAIEHDVAEHTHAVADCAAVRRIVGDRDHRYPRRPGMRLVAAPASQRTWRVVTAVGGCVLDRTITLTTAGTTTGTTSRTATGSVPAEGPVADGSAPRKPDR
jgi:hypothetical protein